MKRIETILFLLGCALFVGLIWTIGLPELWRQLTILGWGMIPFVLAEGAAEAIHTAGWRHCLPRNLQSAPFLFLFRVRLAGYAINYFTPTAAVGGEITKIALLSAKGQVADATSGVLVGKVCFALANLLFVAFGILVIAANVHLSALEWGSLLGSGLLVALVILSFLLLQKYGKMGALIRRLAMRNLRARWLQKAASVLTTVDDELTAFYRERPWDIARALGWHLVGYSVGMIPTWLFLQSISSLASLSAAATVWFLGMAFDLVTFAVPLNAGSLEGSRILVLKFLGHAPGAGMTYGIALRLGQMFWATAGLGIRATFGTAKRGAVVTPKIAGTKWPALFKKRTQSYAQSSLPGK